MQAAEKANNLALSSRDRALLERVSAFYLRYYGVVDVNDLLDYLKGNVKYDVSDLVLKQVIHYILYVITHSAVESAEEALDDELTYRELAYEVDRHAYGVLDVRRTMFTYPRGLVTYYTYKEGRNAPEYAVLGYLLRRIYRGVRELKPKYEVNLVDPAKYFSYDLEGELKELDRLKGEFPEGFYRDPVYTDPPWLVRAFNAYSTLRNVEKIRVGTRSRIATITDEKVLRFVLWKLYEVYVFYLVLTVLRQRGYWVDRSEGCHLAKKGERELCIVMNRDLKSSRLHEVDSLSDVSRLRGRPDISLYNKETILFECKYSDDVGYITAGRFKAMAYAFEYDPLTVVLAYPGISEGGEPYDDEEEETAELDRIAMNNGYVDFKFRDREGKVKVIYMARIDPLKENEENLKILEKILGSYLD